MANTFYPKPTIGGNNNTWATYIDMIMRAGGVGALTSELYNDSGSLKLSKGKIGINDGTVEGVAAIDTITTISTAGMSANNWHAVEMSVSGTSVTIAIAAIAGATDESVIDSATKAAYDYEKAGYYISATKRLLGVVYLRTALALGRIVNCESGKLGFKNISIENYVDKTGARSKKYYDIINFESGAWNMDSTGSINVTLPFSIPIAQIKSMNMALMQDTTYVYPNTPFLDLADPELINFGIKLCSATIISIARRTGSTSDGTNFDDAVMNRARIEIKFET